MAMTATATRYDMDEVGRTVRQAVRLMGRNLRVDPRELESEGMVVALEALEKFDPRRGSLGGFVYRVVRRQVGGWVHRQNSPASMPNTQNPDGSWRECAGRADIDKVTLSHSDTPESLYLEREGADRLVAWRTAVAAEVRRVLATMTGTDRQIAQRLWGLDGIPGDQSQGACAALAKRHRVRVEHVYTVRKKLRRRMLDNKRLHALLEELRDIRQTITDEET